MNSSTTSRLLAGHSGEAFNARFKKVLEAHPEYLAMINGQRQSWSPIGETIPCRIEAEALLRALESFPTMPAWLFSCRDAERLWHGEKLADCVALAEGMPQVVAVGINCTAPRHVAGLLGEVAGRTSKPIVVYPNSGEEWDAAKHAWKAEANSVTDWAAAARTWVSLGASGIGGCCRTTPETIRDIRAGLPIHQP